LEKVIGVKFASILGIGVELKLGIGMVPFRTGIRKSLLARQTYFMRHHGGITSKVTEKKKSGTECRPCLVMWR
jgi:hypothetical protein